MENKRFFAFGCSFTRYAYPTWSDILGRQYTEYYNYGQYGAGNMYIFNAIMEADQHHKLNHRDLVIVQWSCSSREDRYIKGKWNTPGGVVNQYSKKEIEKFFDFRGFVLRDIALIKSIKKFLELIGCEFYFISMVPIFTNNMLKELFDADTSDIELFYNDIASFIKESYVDILGPIGQLRPYILYGVEIIDRHPIPTEHYRYIKTVLPHLVKINKSEIVDLDVELSKIYNSHHQGWTHVWPDCVKGTQNIFARI